MNNAIIINQLTKIVNDKLTKTKVKKCFVGFDNNFLRFDKDLINEN